MIYTLQKYKTMRVALQRPKILGPSVDVQVLRKLTLNLRIYIVECKRCVVHASRFTKQPVL